MNFFLTFIFFFFGSKITEGLITPENCGQKHVGEWNWRNDNITTLYINQRGLEKHGPKDTWALGQKVYTYQIGVPWSTDTFKMEIHYVKTNGSKKIPTVETYIWNKDIHYCPKGGYHRQIQKYWELCTYMFDDYVMDGVRENYYKVPTIYQRPDSEFQFIIHMKEQMIYIRRYTYSQSADKVKFVLTTETESCTIDSVFKACSAPYPFVMTPQGRMDPFSFGVVKHGNYFSMATFGCEDGYNLRLKSKPNKEVKHRHTFTTCLRDATWRYTHFFMCVKKPQDEETTG